ncbi:lipopolysaccharide assembly protein LapA domain-containing protein [Faucicola boevrei]|uniref:lipopolysaccharide assembly protein LapA domain-containing protein n=1 Tax=Faucicola boevrei TaxID=346665 RepID=UPI00037E5F71|nr:lipopolysaccharide assembly protein LapA domain-containing protein [Moraxella boevrei]
MRYLIAILLFIVFAYSLMLVLVNSAQTEVNLIFSQVPQMNLGLLLIICILLGVIGGVLLSIILFKVVQIRLENQRLNKELSQTQEKLLQTQSNLEQHLNQHQDTGLPIDSLKQP